ncbi:hypothetical protein T310_10019, partial [Rasamsonia emersonii CBS 393.64]
YTYYIYGQKKNSRAPNTPPNLGVFELDFDTNLFYSSNLITYSIFISNYPFVVGWEDPKTPCEPAKKIFVFPPATGAQSNNLRKGWKPRHRPSSRTTPHWSLHNSFIVKNIAL